MKQIFEIAGFTGEIVGKTGGSKTGWRGEEIETWITQYGIDHTQYVILEDEIVHMNNVLERTVKVNNEYGLQESHIAKVKKLLGL